MKWRQVHDWKVLIKMPLPHHPIVFFAQETGLLRRLPAERECATTAVAPEPVLVVDQSTGTAHPAQCRNSPAEHDQDCLVPQQEKPESEPNQEDLAQPERDSQVPCAELSQQDESKVVTRRMQFRAKAAAKEKRHAKKEAKAANKQKKLELKAEKTRAKDEKKKQQKRRNS